MNNENGPCLYNGLHPYYCTQSGKILLVSVHMMVGLVFTYSICTGPESYCLSAHDVPFEIATYPKSLMRNWDT